MREHLRGQLPGPGGLITLPIVSIPLYVVFDRNRFQGYIIARRNKNEDFAELTSSLKERHLRGNWNFPERDLTPYKALTELARMPFIGGNSAELLINGRITFEVIFEGIRNAREYILVQFFIVNEDELGRELQSLLIQKAREGVRIYFLYDPVGSIRLSASYIREMAIEEIEVRPFQGTAEKRSRFQINLRNHRKIVLIDGHTAYVGGHNVGDDYLGKHPKLTPWRDTHVKVTGPSVLEVQMSLVEDWYWATHSIPQLSWEPGFSKNGSVRTLVVPSGPADDLETCSLMFTHLINSARNRIWIVSPYFVPD